MATNELFRLHLDDFEKSIKSSWQEFQISNDFFDVTLACEDKMIKAHKLIISASSPVLRNILNLNSNPNPFIYLKGVKHKDLEYLLSFMYQGEVNIHQHDLSSFLALADDLKIKGLYDKNETKNLQDAIQDKFFDTEIAKTHKKQKIKHKTDFPYEIDSKKSSELQLEPIKSESIENNEVAKHIDEDELTKNLVNVISSMQVEESQSTLYDDYSFENKENYSPKKLVSSLNVPRGRSPLSKAYACDSCDYIAKRKEHLKMPVASIHEGITYQCSKCNYKATQSGSLKRHCKRRHGL